MTSVSEIKEKDQKDVDFTKVWKNSGKMIFGIWYSFTVTFMVLRGIKTIRKQTST